MPESSIEAGVPSDISRIEWVTLEDAQFRWGNYIDVVEKFDDTARKKIDEILNSSFDENFSRNVAEIVVANSALTDLSQEQKDFFNKYLESFVSLSETGIAELSDCYLLVLGNNAPDRQTDPAILAKELAEAEKIFKERRDTALADGDSNFQYDVIKISLDTPTDIRKQYDDLVKGVSTSSDDVDEGLADGDSQYYAAVRNNDGKTEVIGTAHLIDDSFEVVRNSKKIEIRRVEPGGAVTKPEYRGKGIYKKLLDTEMKDLAESDVPVHLVQGYTKLDSKVLKSIAVMGRALSDPRAADFGLKPHGSPKHFQNESGKFVDHVMSFLPGEQLRAKFG